MSKLTPVQKFNAIANAAHIFAFHEDATEFKILEVLDQGKNCKAIVQLKDGEIKGLYADAVSAVDSLKEFHSVFGSEGPFVLVKQRKTGKDKTVYFIEAQE